MFIIIIMIIAIIIIVIFFQKLPKLNRIKLNITT